MHILINGGTGFIGSKLSDHFISLGFKVSILTRNINKKNPPKSATLIANLSDKKAYYDVIINLAGEPLNKNRWNQKVKNRIYNSRIGSTHKIIDYIKIADIKPKLLITGSAIGFYGSSLSKKFLEEDAPADNSFIHRLCADWESIGIQASEYGVRVCIIRTGIVLDRSHGALAQMIPAFKLGLGAQLGDGTQWMSWIHINDVIQAIDFLIAHEELSGPFNLTAPEAVTNTQFTKELAHSLNRPSFLKLPNFMVKLLFGEMGKALLLEGQRVFPNKLNQAGYVFNYPTLSKALKNIMRE